MISISNEICKSFDSKAQNYEQAALMQNEVGQRLLERLSYLTISPNYILDLGCGPGNFSSKLSKMYPKAVVVGLDFATNMLMQAKGKQRIFRRYPLVAGDMHALPFANGVFDLVFSNQTIHWGHSLPLVFDEVNRVMQKDACFMFTTLGPDTFKEINSSWAFVHPFAHVNEFKDMHDVGDLLMQSRFVDPVMDMEYFSIHYTKVLGLIRALKSQGVRNIHKQRNPGLTGKSAWQTFLNNYESLKTPENKYPLTYEIVYGHAWKGATRKVGNAMETTVPIDKIKVVTR
jgi:malonyl-CoA O-methyltransferase